MGASGRWIAAGCGLPVALGLLLSLFQPGVAVSGGEIRESPLRVSLQSSLTPTPVIENRPGFAVEEQSVEWLFPDSVTFTLKTHGFPFVTAYLCGGATSVNYYLECPRLQTIHYGTPRENIIHGVNLTERFFPPPGVQVAYNWELIDSSGKKAVTPKKSFTLTDNRYNWRSATGAGGRVTVYWYSSNNTLGPSVAERASSSLARIENLMGFTYGKPIVIWVYPDLEALHGAISSGSREWVGGQAIVQW